MFVKICGITNEDDALLAVALGADAVGFVFAPSKRQVAVDRARDIVRRLPPEILTVGVFRDELPARVVDIVGRVGLGAAQLHGHEAPEATRQVKASVPVVIKAFVAGSPEIDDFAAHGADALLLDAAEPGSGRVFDWTLADAAASTGRRVLLAGGLDPRNVADAVAAVGPWGVDVSSGVETAPGVKDPVRLRRFIARAKKAGAALALERGETPHEGLYDWQEDAPWS